MIKSKWLKLSADLNPREALRALSKFGFSMESGQGFDPLSRSPEFIHSRFIERIVIREAITDPFGEVSVFESVRYISTTFRLHFQKSATDYLLEIANPPRSVRQLIFALSEAFQRVTISEMQWPILDIYKNIKAQSPRAKIVKLRAMGIGISSSSVLKAEISSSIDAYSDFHATFPESYSTIERIRIERPFLDGAGFLELTVNGLCTFDESAEDFVRSLILGKF